MTQEMAALELGLDRTILQKMESGVRKVTSTELASLANLYRRDMSELVTLAPLQQDPFTILGRIASNVSPSADGQIATALERLKEAVRIEEFLGGAPRIQPMMYERSRLGLGNAAISDVAEVIASQGIWIAAVPLPEQTSGLFVSHARYGLAIFVNQTHHRARRRFSYAHEYAHALLDRSKGAEPSTIDNMRTLTEKRAKSFASEFLLPAAGVTAALERMRKGGTSRTSSWSYDIFTDDVVHVEVRHDATAQHISTYDVAFLAHAFRVSYEMAAIHLKDLDFIKKTALDRLLSVKEDGRAFMKALNLFDTDDMESQPYL
jgi:Zn-dependent peptidase ImmA (M78 family)